jgi:hypothetical protein
VIQRGDIRWFRFAVPDKRRPVLADGMPSRCALKPEWIRAVDRAQLGPWIASFRPERWSEVRAALLDVLGFDADRDDDEG